MRFLPLQAVEVFNCLLSSACKYSSCQAYLKIAWPSYGDYSKYGNELKRKGTFLRVPFFVFKGYFFMRYVVQMRLQLSMNRLFSSCPASLHFVLAGCNKLFVCLKRLQLCFVGCFTLKNQVSRLCCMPKNYIKSVKRKAKRF